MLDYLLRLHQVVITHKLVTLLRYHIHMKVLLRKRLQVAMKVLIHTTFQHGLVLLNLILRQMNGVTLSDNQH